MPEETSPLASSAKPGADPHAASTPGVSGNIFAACVRLVRPKQWIKNIFVLAPLVFTPKQWDREHGLAAGAAFALFCLASSAAYIWNDLNDLEADRAHPVKRFRPLAAGVLSPQFARVLLVAVGGGALLGGFAVGREFAGYLLIYLVLQVFYSLVLKRVVVLDVMILGIGFVLRVMGGGAAVHIAPSEWLLISTLLLALFLGFTKRRQELNQLSERSTQHREVLAQYSLPFIDQMNGILAGSCIVCYALYTMAPETVGRFGTTHLVRTIPFVIYGLLRYLHLVHLQNLGDSPSDLIWKDRPLQVCIVLWVVTFLWIIHP